MRLSFQREELLRPLSLVSGVVERRQTLPILSYVLLQQREGRLTLTGTDLEIEVVADLPAQKGDDCALTLPARKLLDICRALPAGVELSLQKQAEKVTVKAGRSRFSLLTLPPTDFPIIDVTGWERALTIPQATFKTVLEKTQFCMAQQDVRYYLNGLYLELEGSRLRAVATDGHRMALCDAVLVDKTTEPRHAIVPRKGIQEINRVLDDSAATAEVQFGPNHVRIATPGVAFTSKLIDGRFPDYAKVVPTQQNKLLELKRGEFLEALGRVAILSNEKYRGVRMGLESGRLTLSAHNPEQEEAVEEMEVVYEGEALEIGFNVNYLTDAVAAIRAGEVIVSLGDPTSSCVIYAKDDKSTQYIIMPMRL